MHFRLTIKVHGEIFSLEETNSVRVARFGKRYAVVRHMESLSQVIAVPPLPEGDDEADYRQCRKIVDALWDFAVDNERKQGDGLFDLTEHSGPVDQRYVHEYGGVKPPPSGSSQPPEPDESLPEPVVYYFPIGDGDDYTQADELGGLVGKEIVEAVARSGIIRLSVV